MKRQFPVFNNFDLYKEDFKNDVGLDADGNVHLYIAYFQARRIDEIYQAVIAISESNPDYIAKDDLRMQGHAEKNATDFPDK